MLRTTVARSSIHPRANLSTRRATELASRRTYATAVPPPTPSPPNLTTTIPLPPPKPRKSIVRRVLTPVIVATTLFYGLSLPIGLYSLRYRDFLVEAVPGGEQLGDLLDKYELSGTGGIKHDAQGKPVANAPRKPGKETELTRYAESKARAEGWALTKGQKADPQAAIAEAEKKAKAMSDKIAEAAAAAKAKAGAAAAQVSESVEKAQVKAVEIGSAIKEEIVNHSPSNPQQAAAKAVTPASTLPVYAQRPRDLDATPLPAKKGDNKPYTGPPLPIGFEPAPGYEVRRGAPAPKGEIKPVPVPPMPLPLVAPSVKDLATSEPILGQLASTIDNLASYVANNTESDSANAGGVLTSAQSDIKQLAVRLEGIKKAETDKLEASLKKQASEYSSLLLAAEKDLVSRLDTQEEDWKKAFDEERKTLVGQYKAKLDAELSTQQEIINQRLKEEVVAQGVELQRRWVQEIKTRVEQERGGRLAKLDALEGGLRKLEKVTKENEETLSEAMRARKIFAAVKAIEHKVETGAPFDEELRALQRFVEPSSPTPSSASSSEAESLSLLSTVLSTIHPSVSSSGIASFPSLATRFQSSVAPQLRKASLFPEHGGFLAYLTSYAASTFLFQKEGWAEGEDVVSTIARANFWLAGKNLDLATREVNSLKGWPKALASDWLAQARRHLEVKQALEIAESEATAESLKAI